MLVLALAAGVGSRAPSPAEAAPPAAPATGGDVDKSVAKGSAATTSKQRATKPNKGTAKSKKKASRKKAKAVSRTPTRLSLRRTDNMPRGYAWPPTKQMRIAEAACEAALDELGVSHHPAKREGRIVAPMIIKDAGGSMTLGGISYVSAWRAGPQKLDCQLALALERFGHELHELGVRKVKFGSIFRFTNVRAHGQTKNILSRHALGIAMDIMSFTDATGREASVKDDYPKADPLLLAVENLANASGKFRIVLTPRNDPISHSDHFHLEVAVDYTAKP